MHAARTSSLAFCLVLACISVLSGVQQAQAHKTLGQAKALANAALNKNLHCRYDVKSSAGYWYKQWRLTLGCKPKPTKRRGVFDPTLMSYFKTTQDTRGEWFNVVRWANKSDNCAKRPDSTTCMSCSMNVPRFVKKERVVPFGVYDGWWLYPEPGATCGMCYKILLPQGAMTPRCAQAKAAGRFDLYETYPECPGTGYGNYTTVSQQPWAWRAKLRKDAATGLPYLIAINVEWYDLDAPLEYAVSYLTQGRSPDGMGSWPLRITPVPCPVGRHKLEYAFINATTSPGGYFWKLQIAGQRIPIAAVQARWQGTTKWYPLERSGNRKDSGYGDADGHWQVSVSEFHKASDKLDLAIYCADGSAPKIETGLTPSKMGCGWQDPDCKRYMGKVQC